MPWQNFGGLAAGNQSLSLFDTLASQIALNVVVACSASGTNAITLTPITTAPAVPAYVNGQMFAFVAAATTTGSTTITVGALGAKNAYWGDGTSQVASGELIINQPYLAMFLQALNSAAGGFVIFAPKFPTGVTAGSYTSTNLTVDRFGRITVAATGGGGLSPIANNTVLGNVSGGTATPVALTTTQLTTLVNAFTSSLSGAVPASGGGTTNFLRADGAFAAPAASSGGLVSMQTFTSSQTITIPASTTRAIIKLVGATGGGGASTTSSSGGGGGGGGGYLEKYLTGLTAGNTLVLTIGAAGSGGTAAGAGGAGGATNLASGTQAITTLTANPGQGGGAGILTQPGEATGGAGGTASNGDLNVTGQNGSSGLLAFDATDGTTWGIRGCGGMSGGGRGAGGDGGAPNVVSNGLAGVAGKLTVEWYG